MTETDVAVVGGGIGGLTAAHELAERGFDVTVLEATDRFGGKAGSVPAPIEAQSGHSSGSPDDRPPLHGEHGFRFFPAFYRHVIDTMARIPDGEGTVADNLVETEATLIANVDGPAKIAATRTPETLQGWLEALRPAFAEDLPPADVHFLLERLLYLLTACEARREEELDDVSWWAFIDAENRSPEFRDRLASATQALVALRPQVGSARTIGTIYLQLLVGQLDPTRPTERILNAPTSVAWIEPWVEYLEELGVDCRTNAPARRLAFDGRRITAVELVDGETVVADEFVLAVPVEVAPEFVTPELARVAPELGRIDHLETAWMNGIQFYLSEDVELTRGHQVYTDSPWALTSISQRQFWRDHEYDVRRRGPDAVEGVLSVIVSDWDTPGIRYRKPARECTREEIATEVWTQLKAHLNATTPTLSDDLLVDWFLDPAIVELTDGDGDRVENRSPLLINTVGSLRNRPPADLAVPNLALSADYVRTNSDLASMESANEAGRRAANAVLERRGFGTGAGTGTGIRVRTGTGDGTGNGAGTGIGSGAGMTDRAQIWDLEEPAPFEPFKRQDRIRYRLGLPHPAEVTQSVRTLAGRLSGRV